MPVIVSKSRKDHRFASMVKYIATDKGRHDPRDKRYMLFHNLPSVDLDNVTNAFRQNARFLSDRKGGNVFYHVYISFDKEDEKHLTRSFLDEQAREYLRLRAPNALAYGNVHWNEGKNPHVHLIISANNFREQKRHTLSRAEFNAIHRQLERWQRERIPELKSVVMLDKPPRRKSPVDRERTNRREREKKLLKRLGEESDKVHAHSPESGNLPPKQSKKQMIIATVRSCMENAKGIDSFKALLQAQGMELYHRNGKLTGVICDNRKYRFLRSLGLSQQDLMAIQYPDLARKPSRNRGIQR